jgi:hypothetical protein
MKYPQYKVDGIPFKLTDTDKAKFRQFKKVAKDSLGFDNEQNKFSLSKSDIEILAWNLAVNLLWENIRENH